MHPGGRCAVLGVDTQGGGGTLRSQIMKKTLALLTLVLTLTLAQAAPYFPGAWYATKQIGAIRQAGAIEITFFTDQTMKFDIYLGGEFLETVNASYVENLTFFSFTLTDSDGWLWRGKLNRRTGFLTGTFVSPSRRTAGRFQCARGDNGE